MKLIPILLSSFYCLLFACSKGTTQSGNPPANLVVSATVNPDNSGSVSFSASAANAVTYEYNFGNGSFQTVPSGAITYKYASSGTYTVTVVAKNGSGQTATKSIQVNVTVTLALLWSDEFNTDGAPDPSKWVYDLGAGGFGNAELQYYTSRPENVIVQGGILKIKAIRENYMGSAYTSARIKSQDKFAFKYGRVEVKAKLPAGVGTWPAIWMLGTNINTTGWPACGEIDIMEHRGSELDKIFGTLHYPGRSGGNADGNTKMITNATTEFHIYSLEWSSAFIKIFVDGNLLHSVVNSSAIPFNHDFFFILNVAMGGNFAGAVDPAFSNAGMEVDYIRVYQ